MKKRNAKDKEKCKTTVGVYFVVDYYYFATIITIYTGIHSSLMQYLVNIDAVMSVRRIYLRGVNGANRRRRPNFITYHWGYPFTSRNVVKVKFCS